MTTPSHNPQLIRLLLDLKGASDRRDYDRKHSLARMLIRQHPDQFLVDSEEREIMGVTHQPTGFQFHLPRSVGQGLFQKAAFLEGYVSKSAMQLDISIGDILLGGRFKNIREVVKEIGEDDLGQPTVNGKKLLTSRIEKKLPKDKQSKETQEKTAGRTWRDRVEAYALDDKGRLLGGKFHGDDSFGVYGGGVDPGEDPVTAATREFREEVGRELLNPRLMGIDPVKYKWDPKGDLTDKMKERIKKFFGSRTSFVTGRLGPKTKENRGKDTVAPMHSIRMYKLQEALKSIKANPGSPLNDIQNSRIAAIRLLMAETQEKTAANSQQAARQVKGYHYARGGHKPLNMLTADKDTQQKILKWYAEHTPDKNTDRYLEDRRILEKAMHAEAKKKLGDKVKTKHPLYFRTDYDTKAWGADISEHNIYELDPELLESATFSPGDSFDFLRRRRHNKTRLSDEVKTLMTLVEYRRAGKLDMLPRKTGNYVEGQVWAPYEVRDGKILKTTPQRALK